MNAYEKFFLFVVSLSNHMPFENCVGWADERKPNDLGRSCWAS
jgi:phosphoglycerol transferase MdoB-like AlkP superfamily enzyme